MNPSEIKKGLQCCTSSEYDCNDCPLIEKKQVEGGCGHFLMENAFEYINQLEAEVERLQKSIELMKGAKCVYSYDGETLEYCTSSPCPISKTVDQIKSEAIKEFADELEYEILRNESWNDYPETNQEWQNGYKQCVVDIRVLLKDMVKKMVGDEHAGD